MHFTRRRPSFSKIAIGVCIPNDPHKHSFKHTPSYAPSEFFAGNSETPATVVVRAVYIETEVGVPHCRLSVGGNTKAARNHGANPSSRQHALSPTTHPPISQRRYVHPQTCAFFIHQKATGAGRGGGGILTCCMPKPLNHLSKFFVPRVSNGFISTPC